MTVKCIKPKVLREKCLMLYSLACSLLARLVVNVGSQKGRGKNFFEVVAFLKVFHARLIDFDFFVEFFFHNNILSLRHFIIFLLLSETFSWSLVIVQILKTIHMMNTAQGNVDRKFLNTKLVIFSY